MPLKYTASFFKLGNIYLAMPTRGNLLYKLIQAVISGNKDNVASEHLKFLKQLRF